MDANTYHSSSSQVQIPNKTALTAWLAKHKIDFSAWGEQGTKSVEHLWKEIKAGEVYLQDDPPSRVCAVVKMIIRRGDKILTEAEQLLSNGQHRFRDNLPTEKIKNLEKPLDAAKRCLQEELEFLPQDIKLVKNTYHQQEEWKASPSYPGLLTQYILFTVEAEAHTLPITDFWTEEYNSASSNVKKHFWVWKQTSK